MCQSQGQGVVVRVEGNVRQRETQEKNVTGEQARSHHRRLCKGMKDVKNESVSLFIEKLLHNT